MPNCLAPSIEEGAGNAGCALHPRSRVPKIAHLAHTSIQVQRKHSDIPRAMALRLIPRSPRRRIRLVTVTGGLRSCAPGRARIASAGLAPATGARTTRLHRTNPLRPPTPAKSAIRRVAPENRSRGSSRPATSSAPDAPRPPHPATNVCDDHDTPLDRTGREVIILIFRIVKRNIFQFEGLTEFGKSEVLCPIGWIGRLNPIIRRRICVPRPSRHHREKWCLDRDRPQ